MNYILALDISTTVIGISIFEDYGTYGKLKSIKYLALKLKANSCDESEKLFKKVDIFKNEFLNGLDGLNVTKIAIEEPLLGSNNANTVGTLLKFNGMISYLVSSKFKVIPQYISSYDARKFSFPELMQVRTFKKDGSQLTEKAISKNKPVLFGGHCFKVDKKKVVWEKVCELEPSLEWEYKKNGDLRAENFDMTDSYAVGLGFMKKNGYWI